MCGIAGFIHKGPCSNKCSEMETMIHDSQSCRGPESSNSWTEYEGFTTIHLYHQRLRIQDLSPSADQPMHSTIKASRHIVFNGEIYNKEILRRALIPDHKLNTHSDTEVLLEALVTSSTPEVLSVARGMFAFGYVNSDQREFELVRDRFGEKPLHYFFSKSQIFFSSQFDTAANAMRLLDIPLHVDQGAVYEYLTLGYFPNHSSLFRGICKLPPSSLAKWNLQLDDFKPPLIQRWDALWKTSEQKVADVSELDEALTAAVSDQLIGDVPIGVFLSGGCDSTLVSAIAQKLNSAPIHSFSLGFVQSDFDESKYSLQASRELGTLHHSFTMNEADAFEILPIVLRAFPEPLGDPSVFPTVFISREAKKIVTVVLTGDGADELFFGYGRYSRYQELEEFGAFTHKKGKRFHEILVRLLKLYTRSSFPQHSKVKRLLSFITSMNELDAYISLVGFAHMEFAIDRDAYRDSLLKLKTRWVEFGSSESSTNKLREIDVSSYLVDDILVKVDRAAMAFSLETRAPFLDVRVSELAKSANNEWLREKEQKHVIKANLEKYVSSNIFRRSKMGFGAPIGDWFRTSLHKWASDIVFGFDWASVGVRKAFVHELWKKNEESNDSNATFLWMLLALASSIQSFK